MPDLFTFQATGAETEFFRRDDDQCTPLLLAPLREGESVEDHQRFVLWVENALNHHHAKAIMEVKSALCARLNAPETGAGLISIHAVMLALTLLADSADAQGALNVLTEANAVPVDKYGAPVLAGASEDPALAASDVYVEDDQCEPTDTFMMSVAPADVNVARYVLSQPVRRNGSMTAQDGRSPLQWFRFQNGDLILGCYPQGETYEATETDPARP